jgi:hypothetical protein
MSSFPQMNQYYCNYSTPDFGLGRKRESKNGEKNAGHNTRAKSLKALKYQGNNRK